MIKPVTARLQIAESVWLRDKPIIEQRPGKVKRGEMSGRSVSSVAILPPSALVPTRVSDRSVRVSDAPHLVATL
jgi:hypothetical protein